MDSESSPRLLTIADVCTALGVKKSTVYALMAAGRLRWVPFGSGGRGRRVLPRDLRAFIDTLTDTEAA
jgi:excisionase family DNA binding protein